MIHYSTFSLSFQSVLKCQNFLYLNLIILVLYLKVVPLYSVLGLSSPSNIHLPCLQVWIPLNSILNFSWYRKNLKWRCGIILFIKLKSLFSFAFVQHSFEKNLVLMCNYFNYCYLKYFFPQDPSSNENQHPQAFIHFPVHVHSDNRDFQVKIKCVRKDQIGKYFRITVREREWESEIEIRLYCEGFTPAFKWTDKGDSDWPGNFSSCSFKIWELFSFL